MTVEKTVTRRRRLALPLGLAAAGLVLAGCTADGPAPEGSAAPSGSATAGASSADPSAASASPTDPIAAAASQAAASYAAQAAEGTRRPSPREALETIGPGVDEGAATGGWQSIAASRNDSVSVKNCIRDVLDQGTMDALATHIPNANSLEIVQLFASRDTDHEFLTCSMSTFENLAPGVPGAMVHYQHNINGERLDWCTEEATVVADEYSFDPETGKGLLALLRPGMIGGPDGAPLLPQRTAWACSEDGSQMVGITLGAMEGYGDANQGLEAVENSPVWESTTVVTEARDHLASTWLADPSQVQEVIGESSPFFMDYQMDQETLDAALAVPPGISSAEDFSDQSLIERPEGAPGPIAPGQPPRPVEDEG